MLKKEKLLLLVIFSVSFSFIFIQSLQTPFFSDSTSYLNLRLTKSIGENNFLPLFSDPLGFNGRQLLYSPLLHYIIFIFSIFLPLEFAAKIFSAFSASFIVFPVFLISKKLTNHTNFSLLSSSISFFIPAYLTLNFNTFSHYSIMIPLFFFIIYFMMDIKKFTIHFIILSITGSLLSPSFILLVLGFLFYLVIAKLFNYKIQAARIEAILFMTIITIWSIFMVYKKAFLTHGLGAIWANTPQEILKSFFSGINILNIIYFIGIIPLITGVFIIYKNVQEKTSKELIYLVGFFISALLLTALHLVIPSVGFAIIGIIMTILFSVFIKKIWDYLENAKFRTLRVAVLILIIIGLIFTNIIPSIMYTKNTIDYSDISESVDSLLWMKKNTDKEGAILAEVDKGHIITYFAEMSNTIDSYFLLQNDAAVRVKDTGLAFSALYYTDVISIMQKYDAKYIFLSEDKKQNINLSESDCFNLIYDKKIRIYERKCVMS